MSYITTYDFNTADENLEVTYTELPATSGEFTITDGSKTAVISYSDLKVGDTVFTFLDCKFVSGDEGTYAEGSTVTCEVEPTVETELAKDFNPSDTSMELVLFIGAEDTTIENGVVRLSKDENHLVVGYNGMSVTEGNLQLSNTVVIMGDVMTYGAGSNVELNPETSGLVAELMETEKTHDEKVELQPKLFGWNTEIVQWQTWEIVWDEGEEGEEIDNGKRRNPETQEVVQFDKEKMEAEESHYYEYYVEYVKAVV